MCSEPGCRCWLNSHIPLSTRRNVCLFSIIIQTLSYISVSIGKLQSWNFSIINDFLCLCLKYNLSAARIYSLHCILRRTNLFHEILINIRKPIDFKRMEGGTPESRYFQVKWPSSLSPLTANYQCYTWLIIANVTVLLSKRVPGALDQRNTAEPSSDSELLHLSSELENPFKIISPEQRPILLYVCP